jgi:suppressor of ftsI
MRLASTPDRRSFIKAAGIVIGATIGAGSLLSTRASKQATSVPAQFGNKTPEPLIQPPEVRSANGLLDLMMTAAPGQVQIGDRTFDGLLYNGVYVPLTLRARLGDTLQINFRNNLNFGLDRGGSIGPICAGTGTPSNLHFHGMSVSPKTNGDNVFVHVQPGETFRYRVDIPRTGRQGPGLFWYHPHAHGFVNDQILGGLSGALVVDGMDELFPLLRGLPERIMLIKHVQLADGSEIISINGQLNPLIGIGTGELQFWRIAHVGASKFLRFQIDGMPLYVVATDGHALSQPRKTSELFIGPGERIDAVAIGPATGEHAMRTIPFQNEAWRLPESSLQLATISSNGSYSNAGIEDEVVRQGVMGPRWIDDVRAAPIARRRRLTYSRTPDRKMFLIDDRAVDEARTDQTAKLGDTEEWTVVNMDQQYHSFHIHQTAFLVAEVNGIPSSDDSLRDTYSVPPATDQEPGMLKLLIPFTDPVIVGRFVYHCHAVDHEDKGMMGIIEVVA